MLSLGECPAITLAKARELRAATQTLLDDSIDPALQREIDRELQRYTEHYRFLLPGIRKPSEIPMSAEP